jgi:hypothetical protein
MYLIQPSYDYETQEWDYYSRYVVIISECWGCTATLSVTLDRVKQHHTSHGNRFISVITCY